jgi:hypothetical protein
VAKGTRQQLQRREQETRHDLSQLTDCLKETAAACASDERLAKGERDLWIKQGNIFSSSVAELEAILTDHQYEHVREHRLYKLFEALGSACFIAKRVVDPIENRLRTAPATAAKKAPSQKADEIIAEEAAPIWRKHPSRTRWRVAGEIEERVNERLGAEGLSPLFRRAIANRLEKLRPST